jgi:signal transduction histidine kinase
MFKNRSISTKLVWMNLAVSATALLLASLSFLAYDQVTARSSLVDSLSTQAQIIAANSISSIVFDDPQSAQNTLSALKSSPNIEGAGLLTADGRIFAEYWKDPDQRLRVLPRINRGDADIHTFSARHLTVVRNIEFQGKYLGSIFIRSDLAQIEGRRIHFIQLLILVMLASIVAALLASALIGRAFTRPVIQLATTARTVSREKNYSLRATPTGDRDEIDTLILAFNEMLSQIQERDAALQSAHNELEQRVDERTAQLKTANRELEAFSYSVSHDLRGPLEIISNMSYMVTSEYGKRLDANGKDFLDRIRQASERMSQLIDDMLNLARVTKTEMHRERVDVSAMVRQIEDELTRRQPERQAEFVVQGGATAVADPKLLRVAMENLLGNAWKYTSNKDSARIEFGSGKREGKSYFYVRDNGAGFDMRAVNRLFQPFQRLHPISEFPGTGIGLATVQRVIQKHGGEVWAEGEVGLGATFYFTLG